VSPAELTTNGTGERRDRGTAGNGFPLRFGGGTPRKGRARGWRSVARRDSSLLHVTVEGRTIATTFWGKAWCENLEHTTVISRIVYREDALTSAMDPSFISKDRTWSGDVMGLRFGGLLTSRSRVAPVPKAHWTSLRTDCAGNVDSLVELLQGRFSKAVMSRICEPKTDYPVTARNPVHLQLPGLRFHVQCTSRPCSTRLAHAWTKVRSC
jgi:hypothetical protein